MENKTEQKLTCKDREILKRARRHEAFMNRFGMPGIYILVSQTRGLLRGMIADHERHPYFSLHHKISNRNVPKEKGGKNALESVI